MDNKNTLCPHCEKAANLAGELIAMIRVNAAHGTWGTSTREEIEEHMKPWIQRLRNLRSMPPTTDIPA